MSQIQSVTLHSQKQQKQTLKNSKHIDVCDYCMHDDVHSKLHSDTPPPLNEEMGYMQTCMHT